MAISPQAQAAIDMMVNGKRMRQGAPPAKDPLLAEYERIFNERRGLRERAVNYVLPEKLTLEYETCEGVHGEWLRYLEGDPEKQRDKVMLFVHGGGFSTGSAQSRRGIAARIALYGKLDSFAINYRQCPEYKFPAPLDDCVTAYVWLLKKGYTPQNIVFFGESAGGNLVLALCHYLKDHYLPLPGAVCAFSPAVEQATGFPSRVTRSNRDPMIGEFFDESEVEPRLKQMMKGDGRIRPFYCLPDEALSPYASPIRGDFSGFPRLMLQVGTEEILYDDAVETANKAKAAGVDVTLHVWEGLFHVFALFDCPETEAVCEEIANFFTK